MLNVRDVMETVRRWWKRIRQAGNNERRRELTDALAWATQTLEALQSEKSRAREEFAEIESAWFAGRPVDPDREPRENYYHSQTEAYCSRAGWCFTAIEVVFAGGLSILLLALPWYVALAVGVLVTTFLALGLKGIIAPLVVGRFADRPKEGRDLVLRLLVWTAPVALVLLAVVFIVRGVAGWLGVLLFPWATGALAVLWPILAAYLFIIAGLYSWSRRLTEQYQALEQAERAVTELRDHCTRALANLPATALPTRSGGVSTLTKAGAVVLMVVCLLGVSGCSGWAQTQDQSVELATTVADAAVVATGELWIDDTVSVDERDRPRAMRAVEEVLPDLSRRNRVSRWLIYGFGEEPWREVSFHEMKLARWQVPACDPPTEAGRIFKVHHSDTECRDRVRAAEQKWHQQERQQLDEMKRIIRNRRTRTARCTSLGDLLLRVSREPGPRVILIVSDGAETCRSGLPQIPPPPADSRVVFLLVGSTPKGDSAIPTLGEQFLKRRQALLRAAPWLHVLAPWELSGALFESADTK